jgi:hypothetical protein
VPVAQFLQPGEAHDMFSDRKFMDLLHAAIRQKPLLKSRVISPE